MKNINNNNGAVSSRYFVFYHNPNTCKLISLTDNRLKSESNWCLFMWSDDCIVLIIKDVIWETFGRLNIWPVWDSESHSVKCYFDWKWHQWRPAASDRARYRFKSYVILHHSLYHFSLTPMFLKTKYILFHYRLYFQQHYNWFWIKAEWN